MSYVDANLGPGERVVYRGNVHWAIGLPWFVLGALLLLPGGEGASAGGVFVVVGIARIVLAKLMNEYAITNKRVVVKRGLIFRDTLELNLSKVESAGLNQGIFGRILGYGTVTVRGSGGTSGKCTYLAKPTDFRQALHLAIEGGESPAERIVPSTSA